MPPVSHQTIKLSKGKHSSPHQGACVMELASMLAGEPFTDHPASVCPVIGSFLRSYNDLVDDGRRQDLYAYASRVVGSRADSTVQSARAELLDAWRLRLRERSWTRFLRPLTPRLPHRRQRPTDAAGATAVRAIKRITDETHAGVLAVLDELLAICPDEKTVAPAGAGDRPASGAHVVSPLA